MIKTSVIYIIIFSLADIVMSIADLIDCRNLDKFIEIVIAYNGVAGFSGNLLFTCEYDGAVFMTKIGFYPIGIAQQTSNEIRVLKMLNTSILEAGISPCILALRYVVDCENITASITHCDDTDIPSTSIEMMRFKLCEYAERVQTGSALNKISFIVIEKCDVTLKMFLGSLYNDALGQAIIRSHLFMLLYTLVCCATKYPGFRHRDLHTDNIMILFDKEYDMTRQKYFVINYKHQQYLIPYFGMYVKIIDFGLTTEDGVADPLMPASPKNISDTLILLRNIHMNSVQRGLHRIIQMLAILDPTKTYVKARINTKTLFPSAEELLASSVFDIYRQDIPDALVFQRYIPLDKS